MCPFPCRGRNATRTPSISAIVTMTDHDTASLSHRFVTALVLVAVMAIADVGWSRYSHEKSLKMSKEEVKQEHKENEGNTEVKGIVETIVNDKLGAYLAENPAVAKRIISKTANVGIEFTAPDVTAASAALAALRANDGSL